jgi:hypothetical protein
MEFHLRIQLPAPLFITMVLGGLALLIGAVA